MDDVTSAYLAGYLERGGAIRIYVNKGKVEESPVIDTSEGESLPIDSTGIFVRVRSEDMTIPRMLNERYKGRLTEGQWQGWNSDAANLLRTVQPYLKTGKRRAIVDLALSFHDFVEMKKHESMGVTFYSAEDVEIIARYEVALREITGSKG